MDDLNVNKTKLYRNESDGSSGCASSASSRCSPVPVLMVEGSVVDVSEQHRCYPTAKSEHKPISRSLSSEAMAEKFHISLEALAHYKEAFRMFDRNNDGSITTAELGTVMKSLGRPTTSLELNNLICQLDEDGNGTIEFEEFVRLMTEREQTSTEKEELKHAFEIFDQDKDGYVSAKDLKLVMRSMGERFTEVELNAMMDEADIDGDGKVNFHEFQTMWKYSDS